MTGQPVRHRLSLDGVWQICADPDPAPVASAGPPETDGWRAARVPGPWQLSLDAQLPAYGAVWYRRSLPIEQIVGSADVTHSLVFEASYYHTQVWVDGIERDCHRGGHLPFEVPLGQLSQGQHELLVRVQLPDDDQTTAGEPSFGQITHGKQSWYGPVGGLWRSVTLETRSAAHLRWIRSRADPERSTVSVGVQCAAVTAAALRVRVEGPTGEVVATQTRSEPAGYESLDLAVAQPERWSPTSPQTYRVTVCLLDGAGEVVDEVCQPVGFRAVTVSGEQILLNQESLPMRGLVDQDYWPETDWTPPDPARVQQQLTWVRDAGFTIIRYHLKVPTQHYLEVADRLGLMIWLDVPNFRDFSALAADEARALLEEMADQLGHHPCVVAWSVINESWGLDLADPIQRTWLTDTVHWLRRRPERWLVVDNSPCEPNGHVDTDLEDYHFYAALPDHQDRWDQFLTAFTKGDWPTYEEGIQAPLRPKVVSELGNWGLPSVGPPTTNSRTQRGPSWHNEMAVPAGVVDRFHDIHLDLVFGDFAALAEASQRLQGEALRYAVSSLRRESVGYVLTELSDVYWEANGLLDQWRRPKAGLAPLIRINGDIAVLLHPRRRAYWGGEQVRCDSSTVGAPVGSRVELELVRDGAAAVRPVDDIVSIPHVDAGEQATLRASLTGPGTSGVLAADEVTLTLFPRPRGQPSVDVTLGTPDPAIAQALSAQGWPADDRLDAQGIWLVPRLDSAAMRHLRGAGTVVLLAGDDEALGPLQWLFPPVSFRSTSGFVTDWLLRTSWLRRDGAFAHLPGGPLLGWEFEGLIPEFGVAGLFASEYRHHVHSGSTMGWLHQPIATLFDRRVGPGHLIVCTWRLTDPDAGAAPARSAVLQGVVTLATTLRSGL